MSKPTIQIFAPSLDAFMGKYINNFQDHLNCSWCTHTVSSDLSKKFKNTNIQEDLDYLYRGNDPRIYTEFLDRACREKSDLLFLPRLTHPEYLLFDLEHRSNLNSKIVISIFAFELFSTSRSRRLALSRLINNKLIKKVIVHNLLGSDCFFPKSLDDSDLDKSKLIFLDEPFYEDKNLYSIKESNTNTQRRQPLGLYFGNLFFGKGVDILLNSANYLNSDAMIKICGNFKKANFKLPNFDAHNLVIEDRYFSEQDMVQEFLNSDFVILPYRKTYMFGTSGILLQAARAGKPVLVPNFNPFNQVIEMYKIGRTFQPEDSFSLAEGIDHMVSENKDFKPELEEYVQTRTTWHDLVKVILE